MSNETTPARWSTQLQAIHERFDKILSNNPFIKILPPLYADDYDIYLKAVLKINPLHVGEIMYKGREVRRIRK